LGEIGARIVFPRLHPLTGLLRPVSNDPIAFEYIPNAEVDNVRINSDGYRDDPFPLQKDVGEVRIVWLGDSIVMGWGVSKEDRFTDILNSKLKDHHPKVRTINLGVESYSNYQELLLMKRKGVALEPDIIILGFCWNDILKYEHFVNSSGDNRFLLQNESSVYKEDYSLRKRISDYVFIHSRLLDYLRNAAGRVVDELFLIDEGQKKQLPFTDFLDWYMNAWRSKQLDTLEMQIESMQRISQDNNAKFIIVMIPLSIQVDNDSKFEKYLADIDSTQEKLRLYCNFHKIAFYDLEPGLIEASKTKHQVLYLDVWHFNEYGNRATANLIYDYLEEKKFIPWKESIR
jgi:lysophospholipase L1-like esterase